jgi:hypothetical protein
MAVNKIAKAAASIVRPASHRGASARHHDVHTTHHLTSWHLPIPAAPRNPPRRSDQREQINWPHQDQHVQQQPLSDPSPADSIVSFRRRLGVGFSMVTYVADGDPTCNDNKPGGVETRLTGSESAALDGGSELHLIIRTPVTMKSPDRSLPAQKRR